MKKCVFLDTGVLGYITHPQPGEEGRECKAWLLRLLRAGVRFCVPEVCDYELRREYQLNGATRALANLDELGRRIDYVEIETPAMRRAAELWAETRRRGFPTASAEALDGDVIACAQALIGVREEEELVVATTNVKHLRLFVRASTWREIGP